MLEQDMTESAFNGLGDQAFQDFIRKNPNLQVLTGEQLTNPGPLDTSQAFDSNDDDDFVSRDEGQYIF